jgi:hypothetical protein
MFGEVNIKLHSVWSFNKTHSCLYSNPALTDADDDLAVVILDSSGSMQSKQAQMKLIVSAMKCMTNTIGLWNLPEPKGPTALVTTVNEVMAMKIPRVKRIIIVSDGDDNKSGHQKVISRVLDDGSPVFCDLPYMSEVDARRDAVATHFTNLGIEMFVVGVGTEVKDFVNKCAQKGGGVNTAYIETTATADDVAAIMTTVVKRASRSNQTVTTVTASNADKLTKVEVEKLETESKQTTSYSDRKSNLRLLEDGPLFDPEMQMEYMKFIVTFEAKKNNLLTIDVLAIIMWFLSVVKRETLKGDPVAGALIGGRLYPRDKHGRRNGPVFDVPNDSIKPSAWTNTFNRILELLSREPKWIVDRVEGLHDAFADCIANKQVGPIFIDVRMPASFIAITPEYLPFINTCLYYKFKQDTYPHYVLNHRAVAMPIHPDFDERLLKKLPIVYRGNSGPTSYGGPIYDVPEQSASDLEPCLASGDEESSVDIDDEEETVTAQAQVNRLKRKVEVLETANEQLQKKLDAMKSLLAE